jgi:hypothetical protein
VTVEIDLGIDGFVDFWDWAVRVEERREEKFSLAGYDQTQLTPVIGKEGVVLE